MRPLTALLVTVALVSTACSAGAASPARDQAVQQLEALGPDRRTEDVVAAATAAGDARSRSAVPYLIDLLRVEFDARRVEAVTESLSRITGLAARGEQVSDHVTFGSWLLDAPDIVPPATYPAWKARLYGEVSVEFELIINRFDPRTAAEVQWGGVPFDGIPAINVPALINPAAADYLAGTDIVYGAELNGVARAYPRRILDVHELSNDLLGGEPVALANCTLCRSAILYSRRVDGQVLEFVTSGLLLDSNKLMVDRETTSVWRQLTGEAISGPMAGAQLDRFFLSIVTWDEWRQAQPDTLVVALPEQTGPALALGGVTYDEGAAYAEYYAVDDLWFPARSTPGGPPKVSVIGIIHNDRAMAVEAEALLDHGPLQLRVGGDDLTVVPTGGGDARVYLGALNDSAIRLVTETELELSDGRRLSRLQSTPAYWFAWASAYPDSDRWP